MDTNGVGHSSPNHSRKKRRTLGTFPCLHCDKVFTRSDHLSRHNLNHEPKEVYRCDFMMDEYGGVQRPCGKTFVRKDLKERHLRRHSEIMNFSVTRPPKKSSSRRKSSVSSQTTTLSDDSHSHNGSQPLLQISNLLHDNELGSVKGENLVREGLPNGPYQIQEGHLQKQMQDMQQQLIQEQIHNQIQQLPSREIQQIQQPTQLPIQPVNQQGLQQQQLQQHQQQLIQQSQNYLNYQDPVLKSNFNNFIPQSQNDILSWLFTESPTNVNPTGDKKIQRPNNQPINIRHESVPNSKMNPSNERHALLPNYPGNNVVPSPYSASNVSPMTEQINQIGSTVPNQMGQPQFSVDNQIDEALSPFYHYAAPNNYGFQDVNIFLNDDNPLDEVFLRNYQMQTNGPLNKELNSLAVADLNTNSTASTTSPTNTNESSTSRKTSVTFSPESLRPNSQPLEQKLVIHALKRNITKHKHIYVDSLILNHLLKVLPTLSRDVLADLFKHDENYKYTIEDRLSYYLSMYWLVFHPQFTILHKPSFDTNSSPPLLILSMIVIGCNYSSPTQSEILSRSGKKSPEFKFSMQIATPLRFEIFQHQDFKSPVQLWILQSLNMLEWCEKNFLLRRMHERGHIHHGTTVQLLRRSPLLGGNPSSVTKKSSNGGSNNTSAGEEESDASNYVENPGDTTDQDLFVKWVESESMKRITFMTFYLDIIDYIKFRHPPQIMFYQLQLLSLPCDDGQLWESAEVSGSFKKLVKRQKKLRQQKLELKNSDGKINGSKQLLKVKEQSKVRNGESFLSELKKLLKPYEPKEQQAKVKLSIFTRKILLAGLVSIMYQMQQTDLQSNSSLLTSYTNQNSNQRTKIWKEILTKAFDNWNAEMVEEYSAQVLSPTTSSIFNDITTSQVPIPMYHLTQIIGMSDINHYDIAIFGGSPANMSVDATLKDHLIVQRKLNNIWVKIASSNKRSINELINLRSVIHCYLLLWQLMLKPVDDDNLGGSAQCLDWNVNRDYFDSMYAVSIATLVLWCYAFSTSGIESQRFEELKKGHDDFSYDKLIELSAEGGYQYLCRVRQEFLTNLRKDNLHKEFNIHSFGGRTNINYSPHAVISKYCDLLPLISNKQNLSGLCFLVGTKLLSSQWEVIRENAKLILNCGFRSIGKKNVLCLDLFDNELNE